LTTLFLLFSGEHPTLPFSEVEAIFQAEKHPYNIKEKLTQILRVNANKEVVETIKRRSALTRICGLELFSSNTHYTDIIKSINATPLHEHLQENETFAVRVKRIAGASTHLSTIQLEQKIGALLLNQTKAKVNLRKPQKTFLGVLTDKKFVFGIKLAEIQPKTFMERRPKKKPFFHPSALPPKLARVMVNLAQPKKGDLLLDPFCGTASILIEAALIGCKILGCDVKKQMVYGSIQNILHYNLDFEGILLSDARYLPISKADCVVTDPPYGRATTTLGLTTKELIKSVLKKLQDIIPQGKRICIAAPKNVNIKKIAAETNFTHIESHMVYIHRSLTREIAVFEAEK